MKIPWLKEKQKPETPELALGPPSKNGLTYGGFPKGKLVETPPGWKLIMSPPSHLKFETWFRYSNGLELSGYALLTERPLADLNGDHTFVLDDISLACAIEESSGGYTEMSPEQRVQGMMWARERGRSANCLVWWHFHPITGWSSTDENTARQRVHETGANEVLCAMSMVRTPGGAIRCRWDQSGPNDEDNIVVDSIPVFIATPEMAQIEEEAKAEVVELIKQRPGPGFRLYEEQRCPSCERHLFQRWNYCPFCGRELPAGELDKEG